MNRKGFNTKYAFWAALLVGTSLFIAAAWIYFHAAIWERTHNLQPLVLPISLKPETITTPDIKTDLDRDYDIVIDFQGMSIQDKKKSCLLGADGADRCEGTPSIIDISWKLFEGDEIVSEGSSERNPGALFSDTVERPIGRFKGHEGHHYRLLLEVKQDASSLNTASPRLKVQIPRELWEDYVVGTGIKELAAQVLAVIGALVFMFAFLVRWIKARNVASSPI